MISIWFFIGVSLAVNGALITAAGIYQLVNPPADPGVVLFSLHANVWWGAILFVLERSIIGLIYSTLEIQRLRGGMLERPQVMGNLMADEERG